VLVAWIDLADAFAPEAALAAILERGGEAADLDRLLWVRARDEDEALRCCERVMRTEGFELVVFDAYRPGFQPSPSANRPSAARPIRKKRRSQGPRFRVKDVTWLRLSRLAAGTRTALIALSEQASTGSRSEMILELKAHAAHFTEPPHLLESLETRAVIRRHRSRPTGAEVALSVSVSATPRSSPSEAGEPIPSMPSIRQVASPASPIHNKIRRR
jgi:hypothetical protein